jgi:hypothetical protein
MGWGGQRYIEEAVKPSPCHLNSLYSYPDAIKPVNLNTLYMLHARKCSRESLVLLYSIALRTAEG